LSWEWKDIPINACEPSNPNYYYCDATQFSIMVSKRVRALENFVATNPNLPCPENVYQTQLDAEMQPFNQYLPKVGGGTYRAADFVPHCWLPESTKLFEGKPSLYWYVKDALDKGNSIQWTPEIRKLEDLETMAKFNAYLIQDGYSTDFFKDFANYYTSINFADTPSFFHLDSEGRNYNQYFLGSEQGLIEIKNKFIRTVNTIAGLKKNGQIFVICVDSFFKMVCFFSDAGAPAALISQFCCQMDTVIMVKARISCHRVNPAMVATTMPVHRIAGDP